MVRNVHVEVEDDQYDRLSELKDRHGLTWKGMLLEAADSLERDAQD